MNFTLSNIKTRLAIYYSSILLAALLIFALFSYALISYGLFHSLDLSLAAESTEAQEAISQNAGVDLTELISALESKSNNLVFIYDIETGITIGNSAALGDIGIKLLGIADAGQLNTSQVTASPNGGYRVYLVPIDLTVAPGKLLVLARNIDYISESLSEYRNWLLISIPFTFIMAASMGYFISTRAMRPVDIITKTANKINAENMGERISVKSNDELGRLSKTLNSLLDRVNGFIQRQHRFTADASHDLKAPLSVIKAEASLALMKDRSAEEYQRVLNTVDSETEKMKQIIDDLLTLAILDAGPNPELSGKMNLSVFVNAALDNWSSQFAKKGVILNRKVIPGICFTAENEHLGRTINNLLENALKYTASGGAVCVSLAKSGDYITLAVQDTGAGILKEHLPNIFDRFYRVKNSVADGGTGLGLSIVKSTVELYRGRIEMASVPNEGTTFHVILPIN